MKFYIRPIPILDPTLASAAVANGCGRKIAGSPAVFTQIERISRGQEGRATREVLYLSNCDLDPGERDCLERICAPRMPFAGRGLGRPLLMGVVNATPDSFSDGGCLKSTEAVVAHGVRLAREGAEIVDFGGESTRPGAEEVGVEEELDRVVSAVRQFVRSAPDAIASIDTRKARIAAAAIEAGTRIVNDVSAMARDSEMPGLVANSGASVCLMHSQGEPATMQQAPVYDDVVLDVYDWLEARVRETVRSGTGMHRIAIDPGIGFGKTLEHNLALLRDISIFHGLGCAVLLGASRKSFIGQLSGESEPARRIAGSVAVAVQAAGAGVHILRVHDVAETAQALAVWSRIAGRN